MEIEGIINHSLAGIAARKEAILDKLGYCERLQVLWLKIREIHHSEPMQGYLTGIKNVRQLFLSELYMKHFLENSPEDTFIFHGYHLDDIQEYLFLRNKCNEKNNED